MFPAARSNRVTYVVIVLLTGLSVLLGMANAAVPRGRDSQATVARQILEATGVEGGLVVHLGCGDGKLTAALKAGDRYLVHGLDANVENVQRAREYIRSIGQSGSVWVQKLDGAQLPYVDGLVNLIVVEDLGAVPMDEVMRVVAPGGTAYVKRGEEWTSQVKPLPGDIDEWTHYLYDASNNAVSQDRVVAPPHQLQWVGGPEYARSHDHLASISAGVSAGGRIFYIVDEGPIAAVVLQPEWSLVARDAFSGVILWRRPLDDWQWHLRGFRSGPADLSRRLVAVGDRVYVTLGINAPLSVLDAATGKTLDTYAGTEGTREILCDKGKLYVVAGQADAEEARARAARRGERPGFAQVRPQRPAYVEKLPRKRLLALDAATGRVLWRKSDADTAELMPCTLAVSNGRVFFQSPGEIVCLDAVSGKDIWQAARPVARSRLSWTAPTLVVYRDVVLSADRAVAPKKAEDSREIRKVEWIVSSAGGQAPVGELIAFSADDGKRMWSCPAKECYNAPIDVLVADGLVWTGKLVRANEPGITEGRDPMTGEVKRTRPNDQEFFQPGMGHGRCYRNKATCRYLVLGRSGIEFIDVTTGRAIANHWTRGTCQYGVMPANGLLYAPPHSCACFTRSKLTGFNCFAPKRDERGRVGGEAGQAARLQRGPAFDQIRDPRSETQDPSAWPTYRHDVARSGRTTAAIQGGLQPAWRADLGGKLSSVTLADGRLLVARVDAHTVHAIRAEDGEPLWSFTAGGRVDSPPTIWQGRVLFGSADGFVYCLRATDGAMVWRFRAAPSDRRIVAYGQLESCWPVHGSVLVHDGAVYCAAGRSSYLEGGIRLCRLDAKTGRLLSETTVDHRDPKTGHQPKGVVRGTNMPGALPDILSCDDGSIFMRHTRFDLEGKPQEPSVPHLFSPAGYLDDHWWHRTYWLVGTAMATNYGGWPRAGNQRPAGRLLVVGDGTIYGFGRNQYIHHGAHVGIDGATIFHFRAPSDNDRRFTHYRAFAADAQPAKGKPATRFHWTRKLSVLARAMLLAGDDLVLAGPPDLFATEDPHGALEGTQGGRLIVLAAADGTQKAEYELESPPVFDGLAAAAGRLYLATADGRVVCFGGER